MRGDISISNGSDRNYAEIDIRDWIDIRCWMHLGSKPRPCKCAGMSIGYGRARASAANHGDKDKHCEVVNKTELSYVRDRKYVESRSRLQIDIQCIERAEQETAR